MSGDRNAPDYWDGLAAGFPMLRAFIVASIENDPTIDAVIMADMTYEKLGESHAAALTVLFKLAYDLMTAAHNYFEEIGEPVPDPFRSHHDLLFAVIDERAQTVAAQARGDL
jgi:hypothetical protein